LTFDTNVQIQVLKRIQKHLWLEIMVAQL